MSRGAKADPAALAQLRSDIQRAQSTISEASNRLQAALKRADWEDAVKRRFEEDLTELLKAVRRFADDAEALKSTLNRKEQELRKYLGSGS